MSHFYEFRSDSINKRLQYFSEEGILLFTLRLRLCVKVDNKQPITTDDISIISAAQHKNKTETRKANVECDKKV